MNKMINLEVASALYQLDKSDIKSGEEEKKNPVQASSTNSNKKVWPKIIFRKIQEMMKVTIIVCGIYLLHLNWGDGRQENVIDKHLQMGYRSYKQSFELNYFICYVKCDGQV